MGEQDDKGGKTISEKAERGTPAMTVFCISLKTIKTSKTVKDVHGKKKTSFI